MLDKSIREIERERQGLQAQEKKLIAEIKKVAKQGQMVRPPPNSLPSLTYDFILPSYSSIVSFDSTLSHTLLNANILSFMSDKNPHHTLYNRWLGVTFLP